MTTGRRVVQRGPAGSIDLSAALNQLPRQRLLAMQSHQHQRSFLIAIDLIDVDTAGSGQKANHLKGALMRCKHNQRTVLGMARVRANFQHRGFQRALITGTNRQPGVLGKRLGKSRRPEPRADQTAQDCQYVNRVTDQAAHGISQRNNRRQLSPVMRENSSILTPRSSARNCAT